MRIVELIRATHNRSLRWTTSSTLPVRYRQLQCERLEARHLLSGVTLITHGFNSDADGWVTAMAQAIGNRPDLDIDQAIYRLELTDPGHDNGPLEVSNSWLSGPAPTDPSTSSPEITLVLDWSDVAGTLAFGGYTRSTLDVAAAVAEKLVSADFLTGMTQPLAELPFHLLGHSRGGSLVGELAHQLGLYGVWVDQVTTLDPHPVDGIDEPFNLNFNDAPMVAWDNVVYWDNYWRENDELFDFNGEMIAGTYNLQLNDSILAIGGYPYEHSDVHLWYYGTIDTSTNPPANNGDEDVPNDWYNDPHPARDASGYYYSRLVDGQRPPAGLFDQGTGRVSVNAANPVWPNVLQLAVSSSGSEFVISQDVIPTSFAYQYDQDADVSFQLDSDRNPFNNENQPPIYEMAVSATTASPVNVATDIELPAANAVPGNYYLSAQIISSDGHTRYAYAPQPITLVSSGIELPVAENDGYSTNENSPLTVGAPGVLANDTDSQDDPLTAVLHSGPTYGSLTLDEDGSFVYTPDFNFNREDSFQYRATDGTDWSEPATVAITVETEYPWHNGIEPANVNGDEYASPQDVLWLLTTLNEEGGRILPTERPRPLAPPFYDVSRDGLASPQDVLWAIYALNSGSAGEGDGESVAVVTASTADTVAGSPAFSSAATSAPTSAPTTAPANTLMHALASDITSWRATPGASDVALPYTGLPASEALHDTRLWGESRMTWTEEDLEEILESILACRYSPEAEFDTAYK